jgi:hypothetical protein
MRVQFACTASREIEVPPSLEHLVRAAVFENSGDKQFLFSGMMHPMQLFESAFATLFPALARALLPNVSKSPRTRVGSGFCG